MILSVKEIISLTGPVKGVIHVGAHYGEEIPDYIQNDIHHIILFEPTQASYPHLLDMVRQFPNEDIKTYRIALGSSSGRKPMWVEVRNQGQSSSLLEPGTHLKMYPHIKFPYREMVDVMRLDQIISLQEYPIPFSMINMDVQGYELEVLKGAEKTLAEPDLTVIYSEVNTEDVYRNCARLPELDEFLQKFGFSRIWTDLKYRAWGEALYMKIV